MISDEYFLEMRRKLCHAISAVCTECPEPRLPRSEINCEAPESCRCRCARVEGMIKAINGMEGS